MAVTKNRSFLIVVVVVALMALPMMAHSALVNPITTENGGVIGGGNWTSNVSLGWSIADLGGSYLYSYTFQAPSNDSGLSHFILQTSGNFTQNDILNISNDYELGTFSGASPSNPGMPGPLFGIKFEGIEGLAEGSEAWNLTLTSDRAPMEGDFYAKGGESSFAYNSGFGKDIGAKILVPDTETVLGPVAEIVPVPEPGTLMLLGSGLLGIAAWGRKQFRN